jgi:hypothetical protein
MKSNEEEILDRLNELGLNLIWDKYQYNRFDAENKNCIAEIKDRHSFYRHTMIEFDKHSYNTLYSQYANKKFMYAVRMEGFIYIFDITELNKQKHNYRWEWKTIEATTNFENRELVKKFVGYIDINKGYKIDA